VDEDRFGEAEKLGSIMARVIHRLGLARRKEHIALMELWEQVAGADVADRTRIVAFRHNVLKIEVDSPALLHELTFFRKSELLEGLRRGQPAIPIRDILFIHASD